MRGWTGLTCTQDETRDGAGCAVAGKQSSCRHLFTERVTSLGKDWHRPCLRCEKCNKILTPGSHAEHEGKPYCHNPCYCVLFGPKGYGHGGTKCHTYK
ncbi:cysteine-rich protein 1-like isoform X2 [Cheilinus undulatus]|uniref:cysteine-rich protein 1-like isoform X2 n=1 Tax=Cheilinus undulatus TaxID=241271 RepID=UPI001BD5CE6B|nr:cysteine-rich protein 1-like isoform X2 [Cheilinus undulatus]